MATFDDIRSLCTNEDSLSETKLVSILKATQMDPGVLSERDEYGSTLLHYAAIKGRSPEFCRMIH